MPAAGVTVEGGSYMLEHSKVNGEAGDGRRFVIDDPQGGQYRITRGDPVRVRRPWPGEFGFRAVFMWAEPDGEHLTVFGGRGWDPAKRLDRQTGRGEYRTVPAGTVHRMSKAHNERRKL